MKAFGTANILVISPPSNLYSSTYRRVNVNFVMVYIKSSALCLIVLDLLYNITMFTLTILHVLLYKLERGLITEILEVPEAFTARLSYSIYI